MTFREITMADYDKLVPFWKENYFVNEHDSKDRFKLYLEKNPGLSIVVQENQKIIGTMLGAFDGRRGYLQKLVVHKSFRRKGIGKKLVEMTTKKLQTLGCLYITLNVEKELVDFYKSCGFKVTNQVPMNIDI